MSDQPRIEIALAGAPPVATITGMSVDRGFWNRLRAELDSVGADNQASFTVPAHLLISRRALVRRICVDYAVEVRADASATAMLAAANSEFQTLGTALAGENTIDVDQLLRRLDGSRLIRALKGFQERDAAKLISLPHGANFSVPGAGKTVVALAAYEAERVVGRVDRMLVVSPLSAFESWHTECAESFSPPVVIHEFVPGEAPRATAEVLLVNYSKLPNHFEEIADWVMQGQTCVVLDEAHRIKRGRDGAWGRVCLRLAWLAARRDLLTGTPAPQHPSDLESLFDFVWPGQAHRILPPVTFSPIPTDETGALVADAIRPLFVRTRKSELGLRPPDHTVLQLELQGLHGDIYRALTARYAGTIRAGRQLRLDLAQMRRIVMYLLEAATNPALLPIGSAPGDPPVFKHPPLDIPPDSELADLIRDYGSYETPAKFRKLGEILKGNAEKGRKTLVWSYFVRNLELLRRDLARFQPAMVHGGVKSRRVAGGADQLIREDEISRFRHDPSCMVLLANPAAMGEGVSLHRECHDAVYLERTFNAGQYLQSVDRIHRLGLSDTEETRIMFLVTDDTIDQVVAARVDAKAVRLGEMLDDPDIETMALPDEDDLLVVDSGFGQPIDTDEDVAALFAHLRGE